MDQKLYDKIKGKDTNGMDYDPGGDAAVVAESLSKLLVSVKKPLDNRMISARRVYAILGLQKGAEFIGTIKADPNIPDDVKDWFKPSEGGVDVLDTSVAVVVGQVVAADNSITAEDGQKILNFGYELVPEFPGVNATMVQNARDQKAKGL